MNMKGQVALVSGAGSEQGIGMAIARRLGLAGARVLVTASSARIEQRAAELRQEGIEARAWVADLTDEQQVAELASWAEAQWGRVDILVNNAGMAMQGSPEPFAELAQMDLVTWQLSLTRNLTTAFLLTRAVLPGMQGRGYGRIVNISSTTGTRGSNVGESAYSAAKAGMLGLSMGLALEVAKQGITVNSVAPGWIGTDMVRQNTAADPQRLARIMARFPMEKFGQPEDIGWAMAYLLSPAAGYVTGQVLAVDGGAQSGF